MTDIDFDELDKAVNSLMNQRSDESAPIAPTSDDVAVPSPAAPSTPTTPTPPAPSSSAPPAEAFVGPATISKRPAGRFMDVVHPSSDMTNGRPAQPRPSRTGVSLQPSTPTAPTPPAPSTSTPPTEAFVAPPQQITPPTDVPATTEMAPSIPTDMTTEVVAPSAPATPPADELADKIAASLQESAATPLDTPFLPDAVVEKRPLGAAPETTAPSLNDELIATEPAPAEPVADMTIDVPAESTPTEPLAPELSKDIMAIESSDIATATPAAMPVIGADIPQQYTAGPADTPEPAPMFDAASLTPEHDAAPQKKSGILTVLLILLFALIGVAGGAAAYFFLLQ